MKIEKNRAQLPNKHNGANGITSHEYAMAFQKSENETLFSTSDFLLNMGMCSCDKCGNLCSVDYKWCKNCLRHIAIIKLK